MVWFDLGYCGCLVFVVVLVCLGLLVSFWFACMILAV